MFEDMRDVASQLVLKVRLSLDIEGAICNANGAYIFSGSDLVPNISLIHPMTSLALHWMLFLFVPWAIGMLFTYLLPDSLTYNISSMNSFYSVCLNGYFIPMKSVLILAT